MGKNNTKAEKAKRNKDYARKFHKKRPAPTRSYRPHSGPRPEAPPGESVAGADGPV